VLFNSLEFLFILLPATLALYYLVRRQVSHRAALFVLTVASLVFYGWWNPIYLGILGASIIINQFLAIEIAKQRNKHWLTGGIVFNLALIGVFKYLDFAIGNVNTITGAEIPLQGLPLPLAISFFTFQQISYLVDVSRKQTEPGAWLNQTLFVAFFPQLIAGPIVRHSQISDQFADTERKDNLADNLGVGASIFAIGLAKKVLLADNLEPYASSAFDAAADGATVGFLEAWASALSYSFQIFFDFSGYSDMALGLARMFGFHLPANFNAPYRARSIVDFWHRWHITLSRFLRDYLYIPLGGNRHGQFRLGVNVALVMLLGGLWHGAAWTFVVWGGIHGLALAWCHWLNRVRPDGLFAPGFKWISPILTFLFVTVAWVFFRAENFAAAGEMLSAMVYVNGFGPLTNDEPFIGAVLSLLIIWRLPDTISLFQNALDPRTLEGLQSDLQKGSRWKPGIGTAIGLASLFFFAIINSWTVAEFIYYQF